MPPCPRSVRGADWPPLVDTKCTATDNSVASRLAFISQEVLRLAADRSELCVPQKRPDGQLPDPVELGNQLPGFLGLIRKGNEV